MAPTMPGILYDLSNDVAIFFKPFESGHFKMFRVLLAVNTQPITLNKTALTEDFLILKRFPTSLKQFVLAMYHKKMYISFSGPIRVRPPPITDGKLFEVLYLSTI